MESNDQIRILERSAFCELAKMLTTIYPLLVESRTLQPCLSPELTPSTKCTKISPMDIISSKVIRISN
jgi:hypothetical protein